MVYTQPYPLPSARGSSSSAPCRRSKRISLKQAGKVSLRDESADSDVQKYDTRVASLFNHVIKRQVYGLNERSVEDVVAKHLSNTMPAIFKEHELDLGSVDKVFASQWVNNTQVVMGTKCNKILIKNVRTDDTLLIPSLRGSGDTVPAECPCGIHSIAMNPSRTLVATGAENTNELAVYRLPSFDPVMLGEEGHTDWIFDIKWVDDEYCFTGSRDSKLALWRVTDDELDCDTKVTNFITGQASTLPSFDYKKTIPAEVKHCTGAEKVRALAYNQQAMELGVLSLNNKIHTWDICTFSQKESKKLPFPRETVCMTYDPNKQVYAVGSQSHVSLMDRDLKPVFNIESMHKGYGIRSVSFNQNILTIGTGLGSILFYDLNAGRYLQCNCGHTCILTVGQGYLLRDVTWRDYFSGYEYHNAIYTHCYDDSGSRLFAAGGPLPACLYGNYAGVWQ